MEEKVLFISQTDMETSIVCLCRDLIINAQLSVNTIHHVMKCYMIRSVLMCLWSVLLQFENESFQTHAAVKTTLNDTSCVWTTEPELS